MAAEQNDLGQVDEIDVEAIGEPGHRTFRVVLSCGPTTASLWMEKEQLEQMGVVLEQQVAQATRGGPTAGQLTLDLAAHFPARPTLDLHVGRMAVGFDEDARKFAVTINPVEEDSRAISFVFSQAQAEALTNKIVTVASAGRPRCPLCGAPMDGGPHTCPATNGHVHN